MLEHHIQRQILHNAVVGKTTFAAMQPPAVASNLYNYHLKQLLAQKLLTKTASGNYELTERGRLEGIHLGTKPAAASAEAHTVLLLAVRHQGAWLLRQRLAEPNRGLIGFVHGEPIAGETVTATAQRRLLDKTSLTADFSVRASGLITIYRGGELASFSHCILLVGDNPTGELLAEDETGRNSWQAEPNFADAAYLPSMPLLADIVTGQNQASWFEQIYHL